MRPCRPCQGGIKISEVILLVIKRGRRVLRDRHSLHVTPVERILAGIFPRQIICCHAISIESVFDLENTV